jgi:hypothetical protein
MTQNKKVHLGTGRHQDERNEVVRKKRVETSCPLLMGWKNLLPPIIRVAGTFKMLVTSTRPVHGVTTQRTTVPHSC